MTTRRRSRRRRGQSPPQSKKDPRLRWRTPLQSDVVVLPHRQSRGEEEATATSLTSQVNSRLDSHYVSTTTFPRSAPRADDKYRKRTKSPQNKKRCSRRVWPVGGGNEPDICIHRCVLVLRSIRKCAINALSWQRTTFYRTVDHVELLLWLSPVNVASGGADGVTRVSRQAM